MKNVWIIVGLLLVGFAGIFFFLHKDGAPTEWERRQAAHQAWKQSATEPMNPRPAYFQEGMPAPEKSEDVEIRLPASTEKKSK